MMVSESQGGNRGRLITRGQAQKVILDRICIFNESAYHLSIHRDPGPFLLTHPDGNSVDHPQAQPTIAPRAR